MWTPLLGARLVRLRLVGGATSSVEERVAEGDVGLLGFGGRQLRSACRLPTEGSTVIGCFSASQAAVRKVTSLGASVTSTWNGRLVSGPDGTMIRLLSLIRSANGPSNCV